MESDMSTIEQDLRERWLPSAAQMAEADAVLATFEKDPAEWDSGVYTIHLLLNKSFGWWAEDVVVHPLEGQVFTTRSSALEALAEAAANWHEVHGGKLTGGYAWHSAPGHAAVWEDIMAQHGEG